MFFVKYRSKRCDKTRQLSFSRGRLLRGWAGMKYMVKQKRVNSRHRFCRPSAITQASLVHPSTISTKVFFFPRRSLPSAKITALFSRTPPVPCSDIGTDAYFSCYPPRNLSGFRSSQISQGLSLSLSLSLCSSFLVAQVQCGGKK